MVPVPAGPFLMGTGDEQVQDMLKRFEWAKELQKHGWFKREQPQHEVTLPPFEIGRYPVTNAEYAAFVEASRYDAPRHWRDGRLPEELADHPVTYVAWHDAHAYVDWLRDRTEQPYRLPSEAEWEKAARGEDGRLWPWGDDWDPMRANCMPAGPGEMTPVGQYSPAGDSPYGCADMAGNIWEWCSSFYREYPYQVDDQRENPETIGSPLLRGGCFREHPNFVRCTYRNSSHPDGRSRYVGFRVARGPAP
jgi:formylglycine-generating enzyme required for sulfatase activity